MQSRPISVSSFNVNGVLGPITSGEILSKLKKEKIQMALPQESHFNDTEHTKLNKMDLNPIYSSSYKSGRWMGMAFLLSSAVNYALNISESGRNLSASA